VTQQLKNKLKFWFV